MEMDVYDIALPNGSKLNNRYLIHQVYYWGHTGILYMATDCNTEEIVAVKEFCPYFYANRDMDGKTVICKGKRYERTFASAYKAFQQECEIVKKLLELKETREGRILKYKDDFQENNTIYLVTEFIEGISLDEMIDKEINFPLKESMYTLVKTVRAIHKKGIFHRDIKPSNIIFREDGGIVLIDFGSACYKKNQNLEVSFVSRGFSAPELYTRESSGAVTDTYSIGALLYYLLTGIQMTSADERIRGEKVQPMEELVEVSAMMRCIVNKCIQLEKHKRWKSLRLLQKLLQ